MSWLSDNANSITAISTVIYTLITGLIAYYARKALSSWKDEKAFIHKAEFLANAKILKQEIDDYYDKNKDIKEAESDIPEYLNAWMHLYSKDADKYNLECNLLYKNLIKSQNLLFVLLIDKKKRELILNLTKELKTYKSKVSGNYINIMNLYNQNILLRQASQQFIVDNQSEILKLQKSCCQLLKKVIKELS